MKSRTYRLIGLLLLVALAGCSAIEIRRGGSEPASPSATDSVAQPSTSTEALPAAAPTAADEPASSSDAPADTTSTTSTTYEVQLGDTLWGIAMAYGVSLDELMAANGLEDPHTLWAGQELVIPGVAEAVAEVPRLSPEPTSAAVGVGTNDVARSARVNVTPTPSVDLEPLLDQTLLEPVLHDWQKLNNCAPTTVAMALSYYDLMLTQFDTAPELKGGSKDKNVSPPEIVAYLQDQGFGGIVRVNGDIETLQRLVSNDIPVIVEQWLDRPGDELTGHYRLVRGYDESTQEMVVNDSYSGPNLHFSYEEFDRLWRPFNRVYIPVYRPENESVVRAIVGENWDDARMYERAAERARAEVETLGDAYAWFNLGNSLLRQGHPERAAEAFDRAIEIGLPPRMLWYQFGPFEAYNQTGQFQRVIEVSAPLTGFALEELHYQRGVAFEGLGNQAAALAEYQQAAQLNSRLTKAAEAVARLTDGVGSSG